MWLTVLCLTGCAWLFCGWLLCSWLFCACLWLTVFCQTVLKADCFVVYCFVVDCFVPDCFVLYSLMPDFLWQTVFCLLFRGWLFCGWLLCGCDCFVSDCCIRVPRESLGLEQFSEDLIDTCLGIFLVNDFEINNHVCILRVQPFWHFLGNKVPDQEMNKGKKSSNTIFVSFSRRFERVCRPVLLKKIL